MRKKNVRLKNNTILVTGAIGFIGANLVMELFRQIDSVYVIGIDNMNDYYDVSIKEYRLKQIEKLAEEHPESTWKFIKGSISDKVLIDSLFKEYKPNVVAKKIRFIN